MKKQYLGTVEDAVDVQIVVADESGILRKSKWVSIFISPIVFAVLFFMVIKAPATNELLDKIVVGIFAGGAGAILHAFYCLSTHEERYRKRIRKILVKTRGAEPIKNEYELSDSGFMYRHLGNELKATWDNVQSVRSCDDAITILLAHNGAAMIPRRIFDSDREFDQWVNYIENAIRDQNQTVAHRLSADNANDNPYQTPTI